MTPPLATLKDYAALYLVRFTEEEIARRYAEGRMRCPTHLSTGQETVAVGVIGALNPQDHVFGGHRSHAAYLAKRGSLDALVAELHGKATGCCGGRGGSMHIVDRSVGFMGAYPIVGDAVSIAIGAALAFKMEGSGQRAVVFQGDAAPETGQFWEALNFAALQRLPLLIVVEDNGYATQTPLNQRQPRVRLADRVIPFVAYYPIDDSSVPEIRETVRFALASLPALVHVKTYRYREHVGPNYDWDLGYRSREEVKGAMARDPVEKARRDALSWHGEEAVTLEEQKVQALVEGAFVKAEESPWPMM